MTIAAPSEAYVRALSEARAHHLSSKTYSGKFLRPHAPLIKRAIERHDIKSILDYGCGKAIQYEWVSHSDDASIPGGMTIEQFWGVPVYKFDPAYPPLALPPAPGRTFDMTLITHVLGSIPTWDLMTWVMPTIAEITTKAIYIAEKIGDVRKKVFTAPGEMPRWGSEEWHKVVAGWSKLWPNLNFTLALHERTGDGKIMTLTDYKKGARWTRI